MIGTLPDGARGFDTDQVVAFDVAKLFVDAGYDFVVRYVGRKYAKPNDLSVGEYEDLKRAGLVVGVVQHVAKSPWSPTRELGAAYGRFAASEAKRLGVPIGVTLWCDLEGVSEHSSSSETIEYCNAWYDAVALERYEPGLYVGDSCRLTASELYRCLKFELYWIAYNLDRDQVPAVRGYCMRQRPFPASSPIPGCPFEYDEDYVRADAFGRSPVFARADL